MVKPSEFNRRIILRNYNYVQGTNGGITPTLIESVTVWAKVENKSGNITTEQAQVQWQDYTRVTIRFQSKFNSNWVIDYEGQRYTISSLSVENEGYKEYLVFKCGTSKKIDIAS